MATLRAGLSANGKAWLQQEVLRALARQLGVLSAGCSVSKADLVAAVVEQL